MSISPEMIRKVLYPPERLVEARIVNLVANTSVYLTEIPDIIPMLVELQQIGMDRNANVTAIVEGTTVGRRYECRLGGAAVPVLDDYIPLNVPFDETMSVSFYSIANIANYQSRAIYEVKNYSIADKLALGVPLTALTDGERALVEKYQLQNKIVSGELPMPYPEGALVYQVDGTFSGDLSAGDEKTICELVVPAGQKAVLRQIWAKRPTANYGDLELRVYRERELYFKIWPYCLPEFATTTRYIRPIELWIPAVRHLRITVYSGTGHLGVLAMAKVDLRRLSVWDKLSWGLMADRRITPEWEADLADKLALAEKLKAGLYTPLVPITG